MTVSELTYFTKKIIICSTISLIGATFVGIIKFIVELLYGYPIIASAKEGAVFFLIIYLSIWISGLVGTIFLLRKRAKAAGVTIDYVSKLLPRERKAFEKEHGF